MNSELNNKEEAKAVKASEKLEENWEPIEDGIKDSYKDLYEKIEVPMGAIQSSAKANPIDTNTITSAIKELDKLLTEMKNLK
ncbi:hypothetical protein ACJDT4_03350 [Clostridium neuense]|uniref:Uncharacterized protein n=1 Tax=Clostridium neuense TaxID=1728934 RepID=A0ABW8TAK5_9CLOT